MKSCRKAFVLQYRFDDRQKILADFFRRFVSAVGKPPGDGFDEGGGDVVNQVVGGKALFLELALLYVLRDNQLFEVVFKIAEEKLVVLGG